jgi:hypothetical protein
MVLPDLTVDGFVLVRAPLDTLLILSGFFRARNTTTYCGYLSKPDTQITSNLTTAPERGGIKGDPKRVILFK